MSRMNSRRDPIRVTDDPSASPELAAAIEQMRAEHGSLDAVRSLERRLAATLGSDALLDAGRASEVNPHGSLNVVKAITWGVLTLAGLSALFGVSWAHSSQPAQRRQPVSSQRATLVSTPAPERPPAPEPVELALPPAAAAPIQGSPPRRHPRLRAAAALGPTLQPTAQDPAGELLLLRNAQAALRGRDSGAALEFTDRHLHDYPDGIFAQEREVLAIEALLKTDRRPEALQRAQRFIARFDDSSYAFRIRSMLEQAPRSAPTLEPVAAAKDGPAALKPSP
jgi:hypothetical protein